LGFIKKKQRDKTESIGEEHAEENTEDGRVGRKANAEIKNLYKHE
jgi:hypothetical protein